MASVFILLVETNIHVFQSLEHLTTFLEMSDDDELTKENIPVLIANKVLDTGYASYSWDEYQVQ